MIHLIVIGFCVAGFAASRASVPEERPVVPGEVAAPGFEAGRALAVARYLARRPRISGGAGERAAAELVAARLQRFGYAVTVQEGIPMGRTGLRTVNVIGTTPGEARRPRVALGAHLDSFRASGCRGANDNASGVGVLLEVARAVARDKLPCAVQFAFFGGEERWGRHGSFYGSRHYVAAQAAEAPALLAMVAVDMVGRGERIYGWETGNQETYLGALLMRSATRLGLHLLTKRGRLNSDHAAFAAAGVPSMWLQRLPDPAYHSANDRAGNLQRQCVSESGRLLVHLLRSLEAEDVALLEAERSGRRVAAR